MANENVKEFTDSNFQAEVLDSDTPVLVDFWAEWCGPCRMIAPTIDKLATEYKGKVKIGKVNTEENRQTPVHYAINAIPTLLLFKKGEIVNKFVGIPREAEFKKALDEAAA